MYIKLGEVANLLLLYATFIYDLNTFVISYIDSQVSDGPLVACFFIRRNRKNSFKPKPEQCAGHTGFWNQAQWLEI